MRLHVFITVLPLLVSLYASAQPGIKDSIYSPTLKEERRLQIQLPAEYKPGSDQKYQVLYLLDGEWNAELFQQAQAWSRQWGFTSPIIMVGVVNSYPNNVNQRFRDLTPTSAGQNGAGGGPKLLAFLKDELIPYINKKYPSNGSNILWGHSLGGLFVLYTLFTEPQLFDAYIAADPSLWWDHGFLIRYARERMNTVRGIKSLYITGRTGNAWHGMGIDSMVMLLKSTAPSTLQWDTVTYPNETHVSMQGKSAYDGLKYTLAPLFMQDRIHIDPLGGIVVKGMPFTISCNNMLPAKYMRISTDGTTPTLGSTKMQAENVITPVSDVRVNIKSFFVNDSSDKTLAADFKLGKPLSPKKKPSQAIGGAWNYTCYRSAATKEVIKSGITSDTLDLNQLDSNSFFCRIAGYLETGQKGYYTFLIVGEPGTKLFIGEQHLMEIPQGTDYLSWIVPLEKGFYAIRYEYSHPKGGKNFEFYYMLPGAQDNGSIPASAMYYVK
jgi:predicted alpha/beta superfamily hydrolase